MKDGRHVGEAQSGASLRATPPSPEISRARSVLEAAQSELRGVQMKLAAVRMQERRAYDRLAQAQGRLEALIEGKAP